MTFAVIKVLQPVEVMNSVVDTGLVALIGHLELFAYTVLRTLYITMQIENQIYIIIYCIRCIFNYIGPMREPF